MQHQFGFAEPKPRFGVSRVALAPSPIAAGPQSVRGQDVCPAVSSASGVHLLMRVQAQ
jgi:hypothetical protein